MFERLKNIGPGAMIAAAFIGPGTVTTATLCGANFGYTLLWAILFSIFATIVLQEMSARLGVVGRLGLGEAIRKKVTQPVLKIIASVLVIGAILIGNAAYEAGNITGAVLGFNQQFSDLGFSFNPLILVIGIFAFALLYFGKFKLIERSLIAMVSIMGLVFFISAILLKPNWGEVFQGIFIPTLPKDQKSLLIVMGLIGTTVVPYNLFLHASSVKEKWTSEKDLSATRWDTIISVLFGGLITMSIVITSAVAFSGSENSISNVSDLAVQLKPILGNWSSGFIAIGFLAAGLSSSITAPLAAAYATSGILGWNSDLKEKKFRIIWMTVLFIGVIFSTLGLKPLNVILLAQVANGLLLPIIAAFLFWVVNDNKIMKKYTNSLIINILGFIVILITLGLGIKSILSAAGVL